GEWGVRSEGGVPVRGPNRSLSAGIRLFPEETVDQRSDPNRAPSPGVGKSVVGVRAGEAEPAGVHSRRDVPGGSERGLERGAGEGGQRRESPPAAPPPER